MPEPVSQTTKHLNLCPLYIQLDEVESLNTCLIQHFVQTAGEDTTFDDWEKIGWIPEITKRVTPWLKQRTSGGDVGLVQNMLST